MRLSISNLAWELEDDANVAALLRRHGIDAIDVAPSKYFAMDAEIDLAATRRVRDWWSSHGVEVVGMQALLFGTTGLNVFGDEATQRRLLARLERACRVGAELGATRLTFGSPRNRDRGALTTREAEELGAEFFAKLGAIASAHGVIVCLEPNPERYGANFMTDLPSTAAVVRRADHPAIRLQLDVGAAAVIEERLAAVLPPLATLVGHVHLSEPDLVPLGTGGIDHRATAGVLREFLPGHIATIEMLTPAEGRLEHIDRALVLARRCYGT